MGRPYLAPERDVLPLDGVVDFLYAPDAAFGVKGDTGWASFIKLDGRVSVTAKGYTSVYDDNATFPRNVITWAYSGQTSSNRVSGLGYKLDGSDNYRMLPANEQSTGTQVLVLSHRDTATRSARLRVAHGGAIIVDTSVSMGAGGDARTPLHFAAGQVLTGTHAPTPSYYAAARVIGCGLLRDDADDAEILAYLAGRDARQQWDPTRLWLYYAMSGLVFDGTNWVVPNLGDGNAIPLIASGPTSADLVDL